MRPSFLFAVILILVAVAATSGPTDFVKERYRRCGGAFDCANIKNISYPFWGPNRPTYCGHPAFELECTGENPVITIRSERYRILDINLVGRSFAVARADYKDTSCPRTLSNTTIDPTLFRFGSDSQNLTLYYDCPPPATVLGPATLVSAIAANGFNCSNVTGYWRNSVKDTSGAPPAMVEYLAACRLSVLVPAFRALAREIGSLRSLLNSGFGLEWDANNEVCSNCAASGGRCGHESGHFACFCSRGVFPAACITGKNNNSGLVIGIAAGSAAAVGIGLLSAAYFVVRRRKHLKIAHSKTGGGGPSASSMPTASPYAGTPMVPLTNFHESTPSYGGGRPDLESGGTYLGVRVFSYDELEEATDNFDASKELGDGGFGVVYYGKLRDGRAVAVKRLYERNFKRVEQFMNEVQILTRLCHPNLVTLYGCTSRRSRELLLVYEYIPNGTLADHLHGNLSGSGSLPWPLRLAIAMETAAALAYLHSSDIIHRDVKTTNILLDCNFHVKVADFGLSRLFPNDVTHVSTAPQGTPGYVDPEYYQCYHLTDRSDVYSFGVVLVELVSSKKAVDTNRHRHDVNLANMAVSKMQSRSLHELVDPCLGFEGDEEVRRAVMAVAELAFLCLQLDREMRPSMDEVVEGLRRIESRTDGMKINYIINDDALGGGVRGVKREVVHSVSPSSVVNAQWASVPTAPNSF